MQNNHKDPEAPMAQAQWLGGDPLRSESQEVEAADVYVAETEVLLGDSSDKKTDENSKESNSTFSLRNQQTNQYWGRFNDENVTEATYTDEPAIATARLDDRSIRLQFIRRVYTILSCQLLLTFGICALMALNDSVKTLVLGNIAFYYLNFGVSLGTLVALHCCYKRTYPHNFYLLGIFTIAMANTIGVITTMYSEAGLGDLILEAVFITATVFVALTIFTFNSKYDFSFMGAGLGMVLWTMILWGLFAIIFGIHTGFIYALMGTILFSGYIIYDTYMICERLDPEDYIVAAIELYLDLVNLFLHILRLLSEMNRR